MVHSYTGQRRQWHPTPVLLPGKSHGRRSLVGCSPRGCKESDTTERLHFHFSLACIGEGNGNPLQCSCLENPRDGGAWWAAVYGVTQSWTRLKQQQQHIQEYHAITEKKEDVLIWINLKVNYSGLSNAKTDIVCIVWFYLRKPGKKILHIFFLGKL